VFKCSVCGRVLCAEHARLRTICPDCTEKTRLKFSVEKTTKAAESEIRRLVRKFWGEEEQLTFDRRFIVSELRGYVAHVKEELAGFISLADVSDAVIIVALGVLSQYQGSGIGKRLVQEAENEAGERKKRWLLVSTSNDDLPAIGFYQSIGFQIFRVKPNAIAEKHGKVLAGIGGLPVRDELRLRKKLF
jgi:ribosomal protein S18 acetylase RimI-like enzyme